MGVGQRLRAVEDIRLVIARLAWEEQWTWSGVGKKVTTDEVGYARRPTRAERPLNGCQWPPSSLTYYVAFSSRDVVGESQKFNDLLKMRTSRSKARIQ